MEFIKRAHVDGALKIPLEFNINKFRYRFRADIKIPNNIFNIEYNLDNINSFKIQNIIDEISSYFTNFVKEILLTVKFFFGHITIFIENNKISLFEREVYYPLHFNNKKVKWVVYEYNGIQHYEYPNYFHDENNLGSFINGIINDLLKTYLLNDNGVTFFAFPYFISVKMNEPHKIERFIHHQIRKYFNF